MNGAWKTLPDNPKPATAVRIGEEAMCLGYRSSFTSRPLPTDALSLPHPSSATLYLGGRYPGSRWDIGEPYTLMGNAVPGSSVRLKPVR
ncbi:hypothetical protein NicSoilE8_36610 [Arthrobacter sp. NicSoilE8]|nr:hypothetical protein NicSoilE8_36610 [Arthrobacter sp. NicSoilE8]